MLKLFIKRFAVFVCLLILEAFLAILVFLGYSFVTANSYLFGLPMGDSSATAKAWLDQNQDGLKDANELPLKDICVWASTSLEMYKENDISRICSFPDHLTDETGKWAGDLIVQGFFCKFDQVVPREKACD